MVLSGLAGGDVMIDRSSCGLVKSSIANSSDSEDSENDDANWSGKVE